MASKKPVKKTAKKTSSASSAPASSAPASPRQMQDAIAYLENHPSVDHITLGRINAVPLSEMSADSAQGLLTTARKFGFKG